MARILIIRFSAIGDVAMTIPVIHSLATQYSQHQITVLSRAYMAALFKQMPPNVVFKGVDLKKDYPGIFGLSKLYKELKAEDYDYIADFHDVLRSKYLRWRFCLNGKKVAHINKGRKEKKELTRPTHKKNIQLSTSFERYARVLDQLNMPIRLNFTSIYNQGKGNIESLSHLTGTKADYKWIGIAQCKNLLVWRRKKGNGNPVGMGKAIPINRMHSREIEMGYGIGTNEPLRRNAQHGFQQYAFSIFGWYTCSIHLGSYTPACRIHGMEAVYG